MSNTLVGSFATGFKPATEPQNWTPALAEVQFRAFVASADGLEGLNREQRIERFDAARQEAGVVPLGELLK